jgi:hypothetical protein
VKEILKIINNTPIADTHEHLFEEKDRLKNSSSGSPNDIGALFIQYIDSDLIVAGMPEKNLEKLKDPSVDPGFLLMDLCVSQISSDFDPEIASRLIRRDIQSIDDCKAVHRAFALYGSKAIALAKHYPNAYIDMC